MARADRPNFQAEGAAVDKARAREDLERDNELAGLRKILADEDVRAFLWRVMVRTEMFMDPMQSNFGMVGHSLGRAAIGKWIMGEIVEAEPNAWLEMQRAHYQKQMEAAALAAQADAERLSSDE